MWMRDLPSPPSSGGRRALLAAAGTLLLPSLARAQNWTPSQPVRVIVPFAPAGNADVVARLVAGALSTVLGVPMPVENRHSGGGIAGMRAVAAAPPDGHTIMVGALATHALSLGLYSNFPLHPLDDFLNVTISCIHGGSLLAIGRSMPAQTLDELRDELRRSPGRYNWGSSGVGTTTHIAGSMLVHLLNVQAQHVPFRGSSASITELIAGRLDFTIDSIDIMAPAVRRGDLKAVLVTGDRRSPLLPEIPTAAEAGLPELQIATWTPWSLPKGTPPAIVERFYDAFQRVLTDPDLVARLAQRGNYATPGMTPHQTRTFIASEIARWVPLVRASGATVD